jgi:hypothetical protein
MADNCPTTTSNEQWITTRCSSVINRESVVCCRLLTARLTINRNSANSASASNEQLMTIEFGDWTLAYTGRRETASSRETLQRIKYSLFAVAG